MQRSSSTLTLQLWERWLTFLNHLQHDPRVDHQNFSQIFYLLLFSSVSLFFQPAEELSGFFSQVAQLMKTRLGQYLRTRPFLTLTLLLFSALAALPVGLFLMFALVTIVISIVGFVFFEGGWNQVSLHSHFVLFCLFFSTSCLFLCLLVFLLLVGGVTLLSVLSGVALFSLLVSVIVNTLLFTVPSLLKRYPNQTKVWATPAAVIRFYLTRHLILLFFSFSPENQEKQSKDETSAPKWDAVNSSVLSWRQPKQPGQDPRIGSDQIYCGYNFIKHKNSPNFEEFFTVSDELKFYDLYVVQYVWFIYKMMDHDFTVSSDWTVRTALFFHHDYML